MTMPQFAAIFFGGALFVVLLVCIIIDKTPLDIIKGIWKE